MKTRFLVALVFGVVLRASGSYAQEFNYSSIDVPCSSAAPTNCPNGLARQTIAESINPAGEIVGAFIDGVGVQHGFLLSRGQFTIIDVPGELVGATGSLSTNATGINPAGDIVGSFVAPVNTSVPPQDPAYARGPARQPASRVFCIVGADSRSCCFLAIPEPFRLTFHRMATSMAACTISISACRCTAPCGAALVGRR